MVVSKLKSGQNVIIRLAELADAEALVAFVHCVSGGDGQFVIWLARMDRQDFDLTDFLMNKILIIQTIRKEPS